MPNMEAINDRWTEERTETLKRLWADGPSAAEIAAALGDGFTRNAVIAKAHRLKLAERRAVGASAQRRPKPMKPNGNKGQPKVNAIVHRARAMQSLPPTPIPADDETDTGIDITKCVGLLDLNNHTCRWPVGPDTGAKQMFCGCHADLIATGPYCDRHTARAEAHR